MFIRSERLFLRPGWPEDWNELYSEIGSAGNSGDTIVRNLASAPWPYTIEAARGFAEMPQAPRHPHFLVTLPRADAKAGGSRLIGSIKLAPCDAGTELGYWIVPDLWNRGYATEAVRAVLSLACALGHRRILANHFVDNPASGRVLRKAGFCPTGEIAPRFSLARGGEALAMIHAITLDEPSDRGEPLEPEMRAA